MGNYIHTLFESLVEETIALKYHAFDRRSKQQPTSDRNTELKPNTTLKKQHQSFRNGLQHQTLVVSPVQQQQAPIISSTLQSHIDDDDDWYDFGIFSSDLGHLIYSYVEVSRTKELHLLKWAQLKLDLTEEIMRRNLPRHSTPIRGLNDSREKVKNKAASETRQMSHLKKYRDKLKKLIEHIKAHGRDRKALFKKCTELSGVKMRAFKMKRSWRALSDTESDIKKLKN